MTPDNGGFALAAYIAAAVIYGGYAVSLVLRERKIRARLESLEDARR